MNMQDTIAKYLSVLSPEVFEFEDQSHLHIGHAGNKGGGHYAILVVSEAFEGMNRVARQRRVQELLTDLFMNKQIHALSIITKTPSEYFN